MQEKRFIAAGLIFAVMLSLSAFAQYETMAGITADSMEYNDYKLCIDSCSQCETSCKTNAYRRAAETQRKEDFCNYLPEYEKQSCKNRIYMAKAIIGKNTAECEKITEDTDKKGCLLNVQAEKAIAAENEAECDSLETFYAENCKQAFYMRMASAKSDKSYCEKITIESVKRVCEENIAMQTGATEAQTTPETTETTSETAESSSSKSLIIYGIIILGIIIIAVIAIVIIKKVSGKKPAQASPLVVQQQKFPPLVTQQNMPQTAQQGEKR